MQDLGTITPSREEFRARAAGTRVIPVHIKILEIRRASCMERV